MQGAAVANAQRQFLHESPDANGSWLRTLSERAIVVVCSLLCSFLASANRRLFPLFVFGIFLLIFFFFFFFETNNIS